MRLFAFFAFSILFTFRLMAQTYSGSGGAIPTNGSPGYYSITPTGLGALQLDTNYGLLSVKININHPYVGDLEISLIPPDGHRIILTSGLGDGGANFTNTNFTDNATTSIIQGNAPYNGSFRPLELIGYVNNGQYSYGTYKLCVLDMYPWSDNGTVASWSITFGNNAPAPFEVETSHLPLVYIDTEGISIPDDPKIPGTIKIINNPDGAENHPADPPQFFGKMGIEKRGSSSQMFPKKSYGLELWDDSGNSVDTSLMDMPAESDWILNANYTDKTLIRNVMAYQIWQDMEHYGTRYKHCELFVNGRYKGIYIFSEKIKRNKNRVDVAKLKPDQNNGDPLTGGYIIKIDKQTGSGGDGWTSSYPPPAHNNGQTIFYQYDYPKQEDITTEQKNYISDYVYDFETALKNENFADTANGYRKYAMEDTFIDYFLVNELSKNVDGYRLSTYLHKERDSKGGKLRMGPVWDYDIAWNNANYCEGNVVSGWAYQFPCPDDYWQVPFWWSRLLQDPLFADHLKCRWLHLRQSTLSNGWFSSYIDSIAGGLNEAQERNFYTWPILGMYIWPNPWPYPDTYSGVVSSLKTWMTNRLTWLDNNMPGYCDLTHSISEETSASGLSIFPNPASQTIQIEYNAKKTGIVQLQIFDQQGKLVTNSRISVKAADSNLGTIDVSTYTPGIYLVKISDNNSVKNKTFVKIN